MNLNLILLLSIVAASPITDSQIGSASIGNDGQNIAESGLDTYSGLASLDIAQIPHSTPLPGQTEAPSTNENICCTKSKGTDKPTCVTSNPRDNCPEPIYNCPEGYEGDLGQCDILTSNDLAILAAIHATFTTGVLIWFCIGAEPAWYCP